ncbi:MAG: hypothetical protein DLD55_03870, partial [candidate division SR1 bacterium]
AKHIPIVPISALHGEGLGNLLKMVTLLQKENQKRIGTTELNRVLSQEQIQKPELFTLNSALFTLNSALFTLNSELFTLNSEGRVQNSEGRVQNSEGRVQA